MTRWQPNARGRLEQAAMELYGDQGFEDTTVAQIAERAGLTERTFFRYFADKREILFAGGAELQELVVAAVAAVPASASPLEAALAGIEVAGAMLEEHRGRRFAHRRQQLIAASPELRERELHKLAALAAGVADALRGRGLDDPGASIVGEVSVTIFRTAFERWVSEPGGAELTALIHESFAALRALTVSEQRVSGGR